MSYSEEDYSMEARDYRKKLEEAKKRQASVKRPHPADVRDEERRQAAEAFIAGNMSPAGITANFTVPGTGPVGPVPASMPTTPLPAVPVAAPASLAFFRARLKEEENNEPGQAPPARQCFAPDWKALKEALKVDRIAVRSTRTVWVVEHHEVPANAIAILGFVGGNGYEEPTGTRRESFEAVVDGSTVYRTDPE